MRHSRRMLMRLVKCWRGLLVVSLLSGIPSSIEAQSNPNLLEGMWSDPLSAVGELCFMACTDTGIDRLNALLDDPANDARLFPELLAEARAHQLEYLRSWLMPAALKTFPLDPADDPGFLRCEPWGLGRQMFAPHQLEIRQRGDDRIELRYGEWDARRTIYLDGMARSTNQPPSRMGHSLGRWDGETLVVDTSGIAANIAMWPDLRTTVEHSDQLRVVERFSRSEDGGTLMLTATMDDPWSMREPVTLKKFWSWAPEQQNRSLSRLRAPDRIQETGDAMKLLRACVLVLSALASSITAASSHHSFAAVYDADRVITVEGVVTQFRFVNPHAMMVMEVTDANGQASQWTVEFSGRLNLSPTRLDRRLHQAWRADYGDR